MASCYPRDAICWRDISCRPVSVTVLQKPLLYRNGSKFLGRRFLLLILHCVFSFHENRLSPKGRLLLSKTLSQNSKLRKMSPCPDVPLTVVNLVGPTTVCRTERLSLCSMCTVRLWRDAARHRLRNDLYCVGWGVKLYSNQMQCVSRVRLQ